MSFATLGLSDVLVRAVAATGYTSPTPVQAQAIPAVLEGRDLMVAAQTGTGKTAGFALPIIEKLYPAGKPDANQRRAPKQVRVLVLTPTRELAAQVHESFRTYGGELPIKTACVFGGVGANPQMKAIAPGLDILVACPGRLLDLVGQRAVDLSKVEILVLDEADRMLDMGFVHDVKKVIAKLPSQRQSLLFSATFSKDITDLANKLLNNPARIQVTPPNTTVERIEQTVYRVPAGHKRALVAHLITMGAWEQVLIFTRTKLAEYLDKNGLPAAAIHGNKSQSARTKALADFKANKLRILVATDIAARGLDIDQLPHVVNFELPNVSEDYVHRIGRTGRAGRSGGAVSLVSPDEEKLLRDIERMTKQKIDEGSLAGFEPPAQAEMNSDRPERARGAPSNGRGQRPAAAPGRGQARSEKPRGDKARSDKPRGEKPRTDRPRTNQPPRAARPNNEPQDSVSEERRHQAHGNRIVPSTPQSDAPRKPAGNRPQREKPALFGR
jgi:ATP-dependent RNA helicase RhlE